MKKLILAMSAIAMLFATSCVKDLASENAGETSVVTFSVATPEMATRAYSDGTTATVLQYAVYDAAGTELTDLTVTDGEIHGSTTVEITLTTGNTYSVIFWAAAPNAPYTVDLENKTMTVSYNGAVSNDENRDAFYKYHTFTVSGAQTETIELKRPFAQLNIGTADYAASTSAGYTPVNSAVTVNSIYNTLNLWDGTVSGETTVTYDYAAIAKNETFPVAGYKYLAMNYLLVAAEDELVDIEFGYTETDATAAKTRKVGSVPVQRNHRTNIYGNLLTSETDFNVVIEPDFDEPALELDDLHKAALNGGEITLTEDVVLTTPLEVVGKLTLNLNGKTLSANIHKSEGPVVKNTGTLTINGGTISSLAENGGAAIQNSGTLVVNDATLNGAVNANGSWPAYTVNNTGVMTINNTTITSYHGSVASYGENALVTMNNSNIDMTGIPGFTNHGIYTYNDGKVVVNGGVIANNAADQASTGGSVINGNVTVNSGDFTGRIENYSGTPVLKGGSYSVKPNANFIAAGYKAVEKDGVYHVVAESTDAVATTTTDLQTAMAEGKNVVLVEDLTIATSEMVGAPYGNKTAVIHNGGVFDGNGNTISQTAGGDNYVIMTNGGTIKNVTIDEGFRGVVVMNANQTVYLENVVCSGEVCYALNTAEGNSTQDIVATNCTFNGWSSWSLVKSATFTNCSFGQGEYYTNVYGRLGKPYVNTLFDGCEFCSKYYIDLSALGADQKVTLKNCTVNGVKLTAQNWTSLVAPEDTCGEGQISIELKNGTYMTDGNVADYITFE